MDIIIGGVYLIDFGFNKGAEFSGKHYAIAITKQIDNTLLVMPITSKKPNKRYKHGITIDNLKYLKEPHANKCFAYARKIREVDRKRVLGKLRYCLDEDDTRRLQDKLVDTFRIIK